MNILYETDRKITNICSSTFWREKRKKIHYNIIDIRNSKIVNQSLFKEDA